MEAGRHDHQHLPVQAVNPSPELLIYATTKAGIHNFTKALAQELAEKGIRMNAIAPGPIWTPLIPATMPKPEGAEPWREHTTGDARDNQGGRSRPTLGLPRVNTSLQRCSPSPAASRSPRRTLGFSPRDCPRNLGTSGCV